MKGKTMAEISFGEWTEPEKVNPFQDDIQTLADQSNPNAAITITVPVEDRAKTEFKVRKAANNIGKTARLRHADESGVTVAGQDEDGNDVHTGNVALIFTLGEKHKARRGGKVVAPQAAADEAPAADAKSGK